MIGPPCFNRVPLSSMLWIQTGLCGNHSGLGGKATNKTLTCLAIPYFTCFHLPRLGRRVGFLRLAMVLLHYITTVWQGNDIRYMRNTTEVGYISPHQLWKTLNANKNPSLLRLYSCSVIVIIEIPMDREDTLFRPRSPTSWQSLVKTASVWTPQMTHLWASSRAQLSGHRKIRKLLIIVKNTYMYDLISNLNYNNCLPAYIGFMENQGNPPQRNPAPQLQGCKLAQEFHWNCCLWQMGVRPESVADQGDRFQLTAAKLQPDVMSSSWNEAFRFLDCIAKHYIRCWWDACLLRTFEMTPCFQLNNRMNGDIVN